MPQRPVSLNRTLSMPVVTFYGLGTIVGAGIYVLVGKVAGLAGYGIVYAFLVAGIVATFTAFSYCELVARFPRAAGEALYVQQGFQQEWLSRCVGWLVVLTGVVSSATITNGFVGYLAVFVDINDPVAITGLVLFLGGVCAWGIKQSAVLVNMVTLISVMGLLYVVYAGLQTPNPQQIAPVFAAPGSADATGILLAAFLAFYAFIGFEDMVNLVEEVEKPRQTLPVAILLAIGLSMVLYVLVAVVAVYAVPVQTLADSAAPLATIVEAAGYSAGLIAVVSMIAVVNGSLVQLIMASRVIYGMATQGLAARFLGHVSRRTQTPVIATGFVTLAVLVFALWLPLTTLAKLTSLIVLSVFMLVNISLIAVKRRENEVDADAVFTVPQWVPLLGAGTCGGLIMFQVLS